MKVQPIYNNKIFKKGLEFAAENSALFAGTVSLALSTVARPIAILSTPKTDKENKKYACAKSLASATIGYLLTFAATMPVANAVKKIDKNPSKYLKETTIKSLKGCEKTLTASKRYNFATQLFKLGLGFLIAVPKSIMTCALIPPFMDNLFHKNKKMQEKELSPKQVSFTGLSKGIGKIIDTKPVQKLSAKFHNSNFELHLMSLTDVLATGAFVYQTDKSKRIENDRKKALIYNSIISTGLSLVCGYGVNKILDKPTETFIKNFREANKNSPKLEKYIEGIRVAKPALILGGIYYIAIPVISTFLADRFDKKRSN